MIHTLIYQELISFGIIITIVAFVLIYIIRQKRKGSKCIGCPDAKTCSTKNLKELCCSEIKKLKN